ncbi:DUF3857 domain-containing protein [Chondrinema litorale]|uniref:DUF3857 domain-containing protein n=1 Tax=Chondrinema litorale TaxID=2994555 RepID=UPI002542C642|nr:DUF3857 domain-containing protein [Chondrinema litorale]UZR98186.1 DUF3857 domain-containing protein [Chondrinema litorale]
MDFRKISHLTFLLLLSIQFLASAQPEKFGKIDKDVLEMSIYEKDSSASAVVLFDVARTYFQYNTGKESFELVFERHRRVKIFNKDGYEYADAYIPTYDKGAHDEEVFAIKGYTYVLEDGKVEKYKLDKSAIYKEQENKYWNSTRFTMPNVTEGCVLEYTYKITSDFYTFLKDWQFQEEIPVIYSEYDVKVPEYYTYQKVTGGFMPLQLKSQNTVSTTVGSGTSTLTYQENQEVWVLEHAPAIKEEDYITTIDDYVVNIKYQLASFQIPGRTYENVLGSWEKINERLLLDEEFGRQVGKGAYLKEFAAQILAKASTEQEKIIYAYEMIRQYMSWNGSSALYASDNLKNIFNNRKGNAADINLLLTSLLQQLDIDAFPIALSTRSNGKLNMALPMIDKLNYVICGVNMGESTLMLDATDKDLLPGMLPIRCLNWMGRIIDKDRSQWINIRPNGGLNATTNVFLQMKDGKLAGDIMSSYKEYSSTMIRKEITKTGLDDMIKEKKADLEDFFIINDHKVSDLEEERKKVDFRYSVEAVDDMADIFYFNPFVEKIVESNPFTQEKRDYPVDFACPIKQKLTATLVLPEGYEVDEIPEPAVVVLPEEAGKFSYQVVSTGQTVQLRCSFEINKVMFLPSEYAYLKEFFNYVVNKQNETIVLKKRT